MLKKPLLITLLLASCQAFAQNTVPATGNVGIGTTNPLSELDVRGNVRIGGGNYSTTTNMTADTYLSISNSDITKSRGIQFSAVDGTYNPRIIIRHVTSPTRQYMELASVFTNTIGYADWLFPNGNFGFGTMSPAAKMDILSTTENLRLSYNATNYTAFNTGSTGNLTITPSGGTTSVTGKMGISNTAPSSLLSIGSNTSVISGQQASVYYGADATSGSYGALTLQTIGFPTANSTAALYGLNAQVGTTTSAFDFNSVCAVRTTAVHRGSGNLQYAYGFLATQPTLTGTGTIGSSFGLYINPQKQTNVNTGYGIYQNGANDLNYFGGNVGIGVANTNNKLTVLQNGSTTPNLLIQDSGTGDAGVAFNVSGVSYTWGIDQSDSKYFKLSNSTTLGTADVLAIGGTNKNLGIGTNPLDAYKLAVNGTMITNGVTVKLTANWPDYVFDKNYSLTSLSALKSYIKENKHLPEMPAAAEVAEKGLDLGETNRVLTKRLEELTLHVIALSEKLDKQAKELDKFRAANNK